MRLHGFTKYGGTHKERHTWIHSGIIHVCIRWEKFLWKMVTDFALEGYLKAPTVVLIEPERAFAGDGENICLPMTEVLLHPAAGDMAKLKKLCD